MSDDQENEEKKERLEELTSSIIESQLDSLTGIESEGEDDTITHRGQPFDPSLIDIQTRNMTIDLLMSRVKHGEINLSPDFQRMGGIWKEQAQSRLIESLLIRLPLPAFYLDASDEENWLVIDGLQRMIALKQFILDKTLILQNLEFWSQYDGMSFDQLPRALQRRIEETQVTVYFLQKGTPHNVKFNIFKRINSGGVTLSSQEIRHALNLGHATTLLKELAESELFQQATDHAIKPDRMIDQEIVLRLLAFLLHNYKTYTNSDDFDSYLNERMQEINRMNESEINRLQEQFEIAMNRTHQLWGKWAFRKQVRGKESRYPISKALFEVWGVNLARLTDQEFKQLLAQKEQLEQKNFDLMENQRFIQAITTNIGETKNVHLRFGEVERIIEECLHD